MSNLFKQKYLDLYCLYLYFLCISYTNVVIKTTTRIILTTFLFVGIIAAAVIGVIFYNPTISLPAFTGFKSESGSYLFPTLFITIACGAVSGFHSLVSSETSSKQIKNEKICYK